MATGKLLRQADAHAVGPDDVRGDLSVVRGLQTQPSIVHARSQRARVQIELGALVNPLVRVERVIARIANVAGRQSGKPDVLVLSGNEIRNQQLGQAGLAERVAQKYVLRLVFIQGMLQLSAERRLARSKDRILAVVLTRDR